MTPAFVNLPHDPETGAFFCHVAAADFFRTARRLLRIPANPDTRHEAWASARPSGRRLLLRSAGLPDELEGRAWADLSPAQRQAIRDAALRLREFAGRLA